MDQIGPYQILWVFGYGGMGTVYRALQPSVNRGVALKSTVPVSRVGRGFRAPHAIWRRTQSGNVSLGAIAWLEIHFDARSPDIVIPIDGLRFMRA